MIHIATLTPQGHIVLQTRVGIPFERELRLHLSLGMCGASEGTR